MWTRFMDMNSGGGQKEKWGKIYIEAPEKVARVIFYNRFGHSPDRVSCTCCGADYSISEYKTLREATAYDRNCEYDKVKEKHIEKQKDFSFGPCPGFEYITLKEYLKKKSILVISKHEIKDSEKLGSVPEQGYVWKD